jgi:CheY-like chemotaxis protein
MPSTILIVDDSADNIQVLRNILEKKYTLLAAKNGKDAIDIAVHQQPDLILLDIMMPDMDGYAVCKALKGNDKTGEIPVIFVTALNDYTNEEKGFDLGAVDYISKPFKKAILLSRIQTHLDLKEKHDILREKLEVEKKLAATIEDMQRITRHDIKSPLSAVIAYPRLILREKDNLTEKQISHLEVVIKAGKTILKMINLSLDMHKMERGTYVVQYLPVNILSIIHEIIQDNIDIYQIQHIGVDIIVNGKPITDETVFEIPGEDLLFYSMLNNLIKNALEASPFNENIRISLDNQQHPAILIYNKGVVPEDMRKSFFDKYATSGKLKGTGLGTYSARLIAETMGGTIHMQSSSDQGTTITIIFSSKVS